MVQLAREDIRTVDALALKGLHLFHHPASSCSQKVRIALNLKGLAWTPHLVDIVHHENLSAYYLGINPRGLVPALVDDGAVHIESNDILFHLESLDSGRRLIPEGRSMEVKAGLAFEDSLHADLRNLTFGFLIRPPKLKSDEDLDAYARLGSGTVGGVADTQRPKEIAFWKHYGTSGVADDDARASAAKFRAAFDELGGSLADSAFLMGDNISLIDIAWFVYAERLRLAGYPFARLHPALADWLERMRAVPEVAREVALPPPVAVLVAEARAAQVVGHRTLAEVCGL